MIGILLFVEKEVGRDRYFFPATNEADGIHSVANFIRQSPRFNAEGQTERGWSVKVIDCEDYEAQDNAIDRRIKTLQNEIRTIIAENDTRRERDEGLRDRICNFALDAFQMLPSRSCS